MQLLMQFTPAPLGLNWAKAEMKYTSIKLIDEAFNFDYH